MAFKVTNISGSDIAMTFVMEDGSRVEKCWRSGESVRGVTYAALDKLLYSRPVVFDVTWDFPDVEKSEKVCWLEEGF